MNQEIGTSVERDTHQDVRFCTTSDGARIAFASAGKAV